MQNEPTYAVVVIPYQEGKIALAQKKQDIHTAHTTLKNTSKRWNGYGGKRTPQDKTLLDTAVREFFEESGALCKAINLEERAVIRFFWPRNASSTPDMIVTFYLLHTWEGAMCETNEMGEPKFFTHDSLPTENMLPADGWIFNLVLNQKNTIADVRMSESGIPQCKITSS